MALAFLHQRTKKRAFVSMEKIAEWTQISTGARPHNSHHGCSSSEAFIFAKNFKTMWSHSRQQSGYQHVSECIVRWLLRHCTDERLCHDETDRQRAEPVGKGPAGELASAARRPYSCPVLSEVKDARFRLRFLQSLRRLCCTDIVETTTYALFPGDLFIMNVVQKYK